MTKLVFDRVPATLSKLVNDRYVTYQVLLDLEVRQVYGQNGVEHEAIAKSQMVAGTAPPDGGPYTLRYAYHGQRYEQIGMRMQFGRLLSGVS